ncbi:hypothetical protein [Streptomyces broussonetiae]|uniref:Uncharacterized protein n=1 Tax=Streptomyces broussonetiae TaxID=2686304 RepID=A0A6I6NC51_9ACTN|nr:hypothetical protein [Streptomyces broussonetiae]QHA05866.1 hypothetical protein GQF42_23555 [Streptomyces broussonetiae]
MCEDLGFERLLGAEGFFARLLGRSPSGAGRDLLYGPADGADPERPVADVLLRELILEQLLR